MNSFLFIDDDEFTIKLFKTLLIKSFPEKKFEIELAYSVQEALELYKEKQFDIVFTDLNMPGKDGFHLIDEIRAINESAFIVVVTGCGSEEIAIESLMRGAISYLKKPVRIEDLKECIARIENLAKLKNKVFIEKSSSLISYLDTLSVKYKIPNSIYFDLTDFINFILFPYEYCINNIVNVKMGLFEILLNAIEHGNLGISSSYKEDLLLKNQWENELKRLLELPQASETFVTVNIEIVRGRMVIIVEDCGDGFDVEMINLKKNSYDPNLSLSGRGVIMASYYFDEISYNAKGNSVTLVKYNPL